MSFLPNQPRSDLAIQPGADPAVENWPLVDELFDYEAFVNAGPIATFAEEHWGAQVAIIGGGAAGLCAAYELLRTGLQPVVFEATGRIGGRNWSKYFPGQAAAFAEMGAMRVPPENKLFYRYVDEFGLTMGDFPDPGLVPTVIYYQNQAFSWDGGDPPGPFAAIKQDWLDFVGPLTTPLNTGYANNDMAAVQAAWQELITKYRDMSFYEALVQGIPKWTTEDLNLFGALGMGSGGFGPLYGVGFLEMLRLLANNFETGQKLVVEGIGQLTQQFAEQEVKLPNGQTTSLALSGAIRTNTPVTALEYDASCPGVNVIWDGGSQLFGAAIVATTTRAMEFIGLTRIPDTDPTSVIDEPSKVSIRNLHLMESSKLFILTETKFWKGSSTIPQNIQTDELPRGVYCLDYANTDNGVVLISYTWGDDSAKLLSLSPAQRLEQFKATIAQISPEFAANLVPVGGDDGILNIDWEAESYYNGAFKLNTPGQEKDVQNAFFQFLSANQPGSKGVYMAGDSVSWVGGWTEGALHTGINAACAVARFLGGQVASPSPLDMNKDLYVYGN